MFKFEWGYCEQCKTSFVYCPKCGNNCCNSAVGELNGETCDVCQLAYQYQDLAWKTKSDPTKEYILEHPAKRPKKKSWFDLDCERRRWIVKEKEKKETKNARHKKN